MPVDMERIATVTGKMLNYRLYVVFSHGKGLDMKPHLLEHLDYMVSIEKAGKLFASGPMGEQGSGNGMTILRVADEAEAREIASNDPFIRNNLREFTIEPWTIMEGSVNISVQFSDGSMRVS